MKNKSKIDILGTIYASSDQIGAIEKELKIGNPNVHTITYKDSIGFRLVTENFEEFEHLILTFKRIFNKYEIDSIGFETNEKNSVFFFK